MKKIIAILWGSAFALSFFLTSCNKSSNPGPTQDSTADPTKTWIVSTFAGSGTAGYANGDSTTNVQFYNPHSITIDQQGDLLVGDGVGRIRMISPSRKVTTWTNDSIARLDTVFGNIYGLCVDSKNEVFAIDYNWVRKFISPTNGSIFAGELMRGFRDGTGRNALFGLIQHLAIDRQDNLFVPDYDTANVFQLRKITLAGVVSTLKLLDNTGVNSNSDGQIWYSYAITVDSTGNIYVGANHNGVIKKITPQGVVSVFAGGGTSDLFDGQGTAARFGNIVDMAFDHSGNLYVVDGNLCSVRKITPGGAVTTIAGSLGQGFADGPGAMAQFRFPSGLAITKDGSTIYVVDAGNSRIRKLTLQ